MEKKREKVTNFELFFFLPQIPDRPEKHLSPITLSPLSIQIHSIINNCFFTTYYRLVLILILQVLILLVVFGSVQLDVVYFEMFF